MIKFKHSVPGFAYFAGDVASLPATVEATLVNNSSCIYIPETETRTNNLPEGLPARELLYNEGLETIDDVRNALPTITELRGVGKKTAKDIAAFLKAIE